MKSHLCGLTPIESARSQPEKWCRNSGHTAAAPAYAASTWSHAPSAAARSAIAAIGSTAADEVVPTVATTAQASVRSSSSGRIANSASAGVALISSSSSRAAFAVDECVCSEQTTTFRSGRAARAAASAVIRPDEALSSMWPCNGSGKPTSCRNQSSDSSSSSCKAGEARQRMPTWLSAAASSSARIPGAAADAGNRRSSEGSASA